MQQMPGFSTGGFSPGGGRSWLRALRWVMIAISLTIAAVLLVRGDYLLGCLIAVLGVFRGIYWIGGSRTRRAWRGARNSDARSGGESPERGILVGFRRDEFKVAVAEIGIDLMQARRAFNRGSSLADLAAGNAVPVDRVIRAVTDDVNARVDAEIAKGTLTQERGLRAKARSSIFAERLVSFHKGQSRRGVVGGHPLGD
jgi:hypothetical protein